jgi:hypothetical protein
MGKARDRVWVLITRTQASRVNDFFREAFFVYGYGSILNFNPMEEV